MNGKENIINKILSDADAKCAKLVANANEQAQQIVDAAKALADKERAELEIRLQSVADERKRNRAASVELDARKYRLGARQQLIADCYKRVYDVICGYSVEQRAKFVGTLLAKYAEKGETVYITQVDASHVTQRFLDGFELDLKLGDRYIRADGGVVLTGDGYEKNLTLNNVIRYLRESTEGNVAAILTGVKDEQ